MIQNLAIVGATGAVGTEFCQLIEERQIEAANIKLLASKRSAGKSIDVGGRPIEVEELKENSFDDVDYALFSAGGDRSKTFAPIAAKAGCVVIDNSSAFRMAEDVPLVVPEINADDISWHKGIIANPNCSTIVMLMAVAPLHRVNPVRRIVVSTYQAVSGAGAAAMEELRTQSADILAGRPAKPVIFPHSCAFNLFSHNTPIDEEGYNTEERKMVKETHKILHDDSIRITATCIRVPVLRAHSESINLTFEKPMSPEEVREILSASPGVRVIDDRTNNHFPMPVEASGIDDVLVGRIRRDISQPNGCGIDLFVSGDQIRKGAALNAVQILEALVRSPAKAGARQT